MVALVDGVPRTLGLVELITHYLAHQKDVITRRTQLELRKAEARAHILEGYLIALQHLDEVIALIRTSADAEAARTGLMERFGLSEEQAQAILDLRLQRLTSLGQDEIRTEHAGLVARIAELRSILGDEARVYALVREELLEVRAQHADERRTLIEDVEGEIDVEALIADEPMVIAITRDSYAKRVSLDEYRVQGRGGVGVPRHGAQGRRPDRAPVRRLGARLPAVLHLGRQGLPPQGLAAAARRPRRQGPRAAEPAAGGGGRARDGRLPHPRLHRRRLPGVRHAPRRRQEDRARCVRHAPQGEGHRGADHPRRRRAGRRAPGRRGRPDHDDQPQRLLRVVPRGATSAPWAARPAACAACGCATPTTR